MGPYWHTWGKNILLLWEYGGSHGGVWGPKVRLCGLWGLWWGDSTCWPRWRRAKKARVGANRRVKPASATIHTSNAHEAAQRRRLLNRQRTQVSAWSWITTWQRPCLQKKTFVHLNLNLFLIGIWLVSAFPIPNWFMLLRSQLYSDLQHHECGIFLMFTLFPLPSSGPPDEMLLVETWAWDLCC